MHLIHENWEWWVKATIGSRGISSFTLWSFVDFPFLLQFVRPLLMYIQNKFEKRGMLLICVFWGVSIKVLFASHLHPSLTGFNLGLEVIVWKMKEHQWTVDVYLNLEALLLPWYHSNLATEACVCLFGVQPTAIAFSSPQGGKGPIGISLDVTQLTWTQLLKWSSFQGI